MFDTLYITKGFLLYCLWFIHPSMMLTTQEHKSRDDRVYHMTSSSPVGYLAVPRGYQNARYSACVWTIVASQPIQLTVIKYKLGSPSDVLTIYDGNDTNSPIIESFTVYRHPYMVYTKTNSMVVKYQGTYTQLLIMLHQSKGKCLSNQKMCGGKDAMCYPIGVHCNGRVDCPITGQDERDCANCESRRKGLIPCGESHDQCYLLSKRCNGVSDCVNKADEYSCPKTLCNSSLGMHMCSDGLCIYERWMCDGSKDCTSGEDELNCNFFLSTKVVLAATIGTILCCLVLTVVLGCICKLMKAYHESIHSRHSRGSVIGQIREQISRQQAPPTYDAALHNESVTSPTRSAHRLRRDRRTNRNTDLSPNPIDNPAFCDDTSAIMTLDDFPDAIIQPHKLRDNHASKLTDDGLPEVELSEVQSEADYSRQDSVTDVPPPPYTDDIQSSQTNYVTNATLSPFNLNAVDNAQHNVENPSVLSDVIISTREGFVSLLDNSLIDSPELSTIQPSSLTFDSPTSQLIDFRGEGSQTRVRHYRSSSDSDCDLIDIV